MGNNNKCPFGRSYDEKHTTCRSCAISCKNKLESWQKQHVSKYGNKKTVVDGIVFDSKKESLRYAELKLLERASKIFSLILQEKFELIPKQCGERAINYVSDFSYFLDGVRIVEDVKGFKTPVYKLKRKLMLFVHGIKIKET